MADTVNASFKTTIDVANKHKFININKRNGICLMLIITNLHSLSQIRSGPLSQCFYTTGVGNVEVQFWIMGYSYN